MSIDNLALQIQTQADQLFPNRTDTSMFLKLYGELGELVASNGDHDEYADLMILLLDYGSRHMIAIEKVVTEKMAVNMTRKWKMNALGVMQHVE